MSVSQAQPSPAQAASAAGGRPYTGRIGDFFLSCVACPRCVCIIRSCPSAIVCGGTRVRIRRIRRGRSKDGDRRQTDARRCVGMHEFPPWRTSCRRPQPCRNVAQGLEHGGPPRSDRRTLPVLVGSSIEYMYVDGFGCAGSSFWIVRCWGRSAESATREARRVEVEHEYYACVCRRMMQY